MIQSKSKECMLNVVLGLKKWLEQAQPLPEINSILDYQIK